MSYIKWGALGAAGVLVADIVGNAQFAQGTPMKNKVIRLVAGGLTVGLLHKLILK